MPSRTAGGEGAGCEKTNELQTKTVVELRRLCSDAGISASGLKADLVERLMDHQRVEQALGASPRSARGPAQAKSPRSALCVARLPLFPLCLPC